MPSDPPFIFKRSKQKPTVRSRQISPDRDVKATGAETLESSPSMLVTKLKNKMKKSQPKSRLSFGGEDEDDNEDAFKIKKSKLSLKASSGARMAIVNPLDQPTASSDGGPKYDAAYLQELKTQNLNTRPPRPSSDVYTDESDISMDVDQVASRNTDMELEDAIMVIPSESSIKVAKEKRERVRRIQASDEQDFISLSVAKRDDNDQGPHPESRLMREEDEVGEGDDEFAEYTSAQERIALGKKSRKAEAMQRRDAMKEMIADAEEEDEETIEWEQEQLRRGGHIATEPTPPAKVKQVYKAAPIPLATPLPTLDSAMTRLSMQLAQLTTSHANNTVTLNSLAQERIQVDDREKEMREMVEKAAIKRTWFMDFRDWTESVAGFLDEKYPLLEKLEKEQLSLLKERYEIISRRRAEDDQDDLAAFYGPLPPRDDAGEHTNNPKVSAEEKQQRSVARVARRQLRSSRRPGNQREEEGYSTDSSLVNSDAAAYSDAIQSLVSQGNDILGDVKAAEFRDPGKGRWSIWRERYPDSYMGAWGGLGVVSVWEFWVRLECLGWDCIADSRSLDTFKWYKGLYEYSHPGTDGTAEQRDLGPDGDLVASMISTAVIPLICALIDNGALNVYSQKDIRRVIDLAEEVESSIEPDGEKFQLLLKSVMRAFERAVSTTESYVAEYIVGYQSRAGFNPNAIQARKRFLNRRIKLLKNLLSWRKYNGDRYGLELLVSRLVERSIINVAEGGWEVGGEEVAKKIAGMLPENLLPFSLRNLRIS